MTVFILKIIACISMILDHVKYAIPSTRCFATIYLGRLAFPIFAFLISEGFFYTHDRLKYMFRILIFAIISQIPFYFFLNNLVLHSKVEFNVLFTFEFALIGLYSLEYFKKAEMNKILKFLIVTIVMVSILNLSYVLHTDYGWYGIALVWIFYIFREKKLLYTFSFVVLNILYYLYLGLEFNAPKEFLPITFSLSSLIFILLYNGKEGKKLKYFFYVFYPLHFIILYGINYFFIK